MSTVAEILAQKGPHVLSIGPEASVLAATIMMNEHNVGALVVTDHREVVGIFTERDVLRRVVGERRDPAGTRVSDVTTGDVYCCRVETTVDKARAIMRDSRIRHLPVLGPGRQLAGLISIGDLNAWDIAHQEVEIKHLHDYLYGEVA